jgi:phage baseplate assembly protein gpV
MDLSPALASRHRTAPTVALGEVTSVRDPENLNRIEVKLLSRTASEGQDATVMARIAVPFAAGGNGAFLIPDVGSQVVIGFLDDDSRYPVVLGALWHGTAAAPETIGDKVDRWTLVGKAGTRIAIEEAASGQPAIKLTTPGGVKVTLLDQGRELTCLAGGAKLTLSPSGVAVDTQAAVTVNGSVVTVKGLMVTVDAPLSIFKGTILCNAVVTSTTVSSTYTPGMGNVL